MSDGASSLEIVPVRGRIVLSATARNRIANYLNFATTALVGLIVNPILLAALGTSGFGIWKTIARLFETVIATQGGATQALKWVLARENAQASADALRRRVGSALVNWALWAAPFAVLALGLVLALPWMFPQAGPDLTIAGLILAINGLVAGLVSIPAYSLIGVNKGYLALGLSALMAGIVGAGLVFAALSGWGLVGMAAMVLFGSVPGAALCYWLAWRAIPWWGIAAPGPVDMADINRLGGWTLGWSAIEKVLLASELVLIALLAGAAMAGQYVFTAYAAQTALVICLLTTNAAMPGLGARLAAGNRAEAAMIIAQTRRTSLLLSFGVGAVIICANAAFVALWAGDAMYLGAGANALIVIAAIQLAHIRTEAQILDAMLIVKPRVLLGAGAVVVGIACAIAGFVLTADITWMIAGLIAGRLALTLGLPAIARRAVRR
ncbi:hypothetical protein SAMN04487974_101141 [Pelagibacterium luteolum]|uniref:Membrane protein involved in the export of O-antigen and teichoic acid n=2 Tax=Pelagibacterium luteolum TaxID=440168 RepID=A0A1G7RV11_9HYPH|nr:hypothetical protein SAMN04487974_101141 [Pelagibacterium luteolum]